MKFKRKFPVSLLKKIVFIVLKEYGNTRISWIFNLNHNLIEIKLLPLKIENMKNELVSFFKDKQRSFSQCNGLITLKRKLFIRQQSHTLSSNYNGHIT